MQENVFSSDFSEIKTKVRNRFDAEARFRVTGTSLLPRLLLILASKQQSISQKL